MVIVQGRHPTNDPEADMQRIILFDIIITSADDALDNLVNGVVVSI